MNKILLLTGAVLLSAVTFVSCGEKKEEKKEEKEKKAEEPFPQEFKDQFMKDCTSDRDTTLTEEMMNEYCQCTLDKIMANYKNADEVANANQMELTGIGLECMTDEMISKMSEGDTIPEEETAE